MTPTAPLSHATVLRIRTGALVRRIKEEAVILVLSENRFLAISSVGARTLELIDGQSSLDGILSRLHDEYDVPREQLEADVHAFLARLMAANVVEVA